MADLASVGLMTARSIASLAVRKGCSGALRTIVQRDFGIDLPDMPCSRATERMIVLWAGPGRWLFLPEADEPDFEQSLRLAVDHVACVTDQTDGRAILRIEGARSRDVLAKLVPIDLHPLVFAADATALTLAGHIPVHIWRSGDDGFNLACFRSYAGSLSAALDQAVSGSER